MALSMLSSSLPQEFIKATTIRSRNQQLPIRRINLSVRSLQLNELVDELVKTRDGNLTTASMMRTSTAKEEITYSNVGEEIYAILEAVEDRVEMHKNIGEQRNNWNQLLLTSVNGMITTAATMAGIGAISGGIGAPLLALKLSSTSLYVAATGILMIMNKIQPSQLAEEQRNASRLFKQLQREIQTIIALKKITPKDVENAMEKVLALDKAYPLPLLGVMLDKFPKRVEPAVWWPEHVDEGPHQLGHSSEAAKNGWNEILEEEMRGVVGLIKRKDEEDYIRLAKLALSINRILAISGPMLTGLAAIGAAFMGSSSNDNTWAIVSAVVCGALATVVNTIEHAGQVGMVFEMYRSSAGFFRLMEQSIETALEEERENGEVFEAKVALELGRSLSELRELARSSSRNSDSKEEFASRLF